jgi:DnaK suppressor protein
MNEHNLQRFKKELTDRLEALHYQANRTVMDQKAFDDHHSDPLDQAAEESIRSFSLRIHNRENRLIRKIQQSLLDIEEGVYGICQICGEPISIRRLEARPVARHCIRCKSEMEKRERQLGN